MSVFVQNWNLETLYRLIMNGKRTFYLTLLIRGKRHFFRNYCINETMSKIYVITQIGQFYVVLRSLSVVCFHFRLIFRKHFSKEVGPCLKEQAR